MSSKSTASSDVWESVSWTRAIEPTRRLFAAARSGSPAEIRRAVLSGVLPPGRKFSIAELSVQFGVSHIPVREALRRLEAQGLIVLRPGRSAMVSPLDRDELRAIFRLRQLLEPDLAARSCAFLTDEDFERAAQLLGMRLEWTGTGIEERGVDAKSGRTIVRIDARYFRPTEVETLLGDASKALHKLGWKPETDFQTLIAEMVKEDLELARRDAVMTREGFKTYQYRE